MKSYTLASEQTAAPTGCDICSRHCFGCIGFVGLTAEHLATTSWAHGSRNENHTGLQIFADGEWHPVKAFTSDLCEPWETCEAENILGEEIEE